MKIEVPFKSLDKIYHIADIHIRLLHRHDEFRAQFDRLFSIWEQQDNKNTVIVVAGDIVHSKLDMSPELIDLTSYFFKRLTDIAETFVILGNHDFFQNNRTRLDALSPIIQNINNPKLHYLKHSGIYDIADAEFVVYSIFDDKDKWPSVSNCVTKKKIGLFHGGVFGATTDLGYTVRNHCLLTTFFDGHDIVLLGDIHKQQVIQEYSIEEEEINENDLEKYLKEGWAISP